MFMEERHQEIAEYIHTNGKILVSDIVKKYGISDESARRDLRILEQKGICKRTCKALFAKPSEVSGKIWQNICGRVLVALARKRRQAEPKDADYAIATELSRKRKS